MDDRRWSAPAAGQPPRGGAELITTSPLPAETGPTWAPDRISIWPVEGGRCGIDAHYHGDTGSERARVQRQRLNKSGLNVDVRTDPEGGSLIRIGPLAHAATWLALEAFLGRPMASP